MTGNSPHPAPSRPWTIEDLINLEYFLRRDPEDGANAAAAARADAKVRSDLAGLDLRRDPEQARREVFHLWLDDQVDSARQTLDGPPLPGGAFTGAIKVVTAALSLSAIAAGAGMILSLLEREPPAFNVPFFFASTVLLQTLVLALFLAGRFFRRMFRSSSLLPLFHQAIGNFAGTVMRWFGGKNQRFGDLRHYFAAYRDILPWPVIGATQTAAIFFNVALLGTFLGCLLFIDIRFYWESTFGDHVDRIMFQITQIASAPWSWLKPEWSPTLEQIQNRGSAGETPAPPEAWYPFLLASIIFWGLVPRLVLREAEALALRRSLRRVSFNQRHHRELWRRLTAVEVHPEAEPPRDSTIVLNWNGIELDPAELHTHLIQQLHLNPTILRSVGLSSSTQDALTLRELTAPEVPDITVVAEAWGLVPRRMQEFHQQIRTAFGDRVPLRLFLIGNPSETTRFTAPLDEDIRVWEDFVDGLEDPLAEVHAFRKRSMTCET